MQRTRTQPIILVVEDYADTREMLRLLLEGLNYGVMTAANAEEALSIAANNHIDLILTDFGLPDMTGLTMVRHIRRLGNHSRSIPVIVLTAFDESQYRELAEQAGVSAFLVKPPDFEFLKRTVSRLLEHREAEVDLPVTI